LSFLGSNSDDSAIGLTLALSGLCGDGMGRRIRRRDSGPIFEEDSTRDSLRRRTTESYYNE
jgi:hypothetical protein